MKCGSVVRIVQSLDRPYPTALKRQCLLDDKLLALLGLYAFHLEDSFL